RGCAFSGVLKYFQGIVSLVTSQRQLQDAKLASCSSRTTASPVLSPTSSLLASCCRVDNPLASSAPASSVRCALPFYVLLCSVLWYLPFTCPEMKLDLRLSAGPSARAVLRTGMVYPHLSAFIRGRNLLRLFPALRISPPASSTRISGIVP